MDTDEKTVQIQWPQKNAQNAKKQKQISPSPGGEGWGEGERLSFH